MSDSELLRGLLEAEGADSFGTPPWLTSDLVEVVGPGPIEAAIDVARSEAPDEVPALLDYLDAYEAEAAAARGDWQRALRLARRAAEKLPATEALLRARTRWIQARGYEARGDLEAAVPRYLEVLQIDPTLLRRTGDRLPVRVVAAGDRLSRRTAALLRRSPRIRDDDRSTLRLQVQAEGGSTCHLCFATVSAGSGGETLGCATETFDDGSSLESTARRCADLLHERLLAPQVDEGLMDPASLDGSNVRGTIDIGGPPR
jgi:tetratricopeptide (TPR) repeat protein